MNPVMNPVRNTSRALVAAVITLAGCEQPRPDLSALAIELTALKRELEFVRLQTEDLDPRVRLSEQLAMQAIDERESPFPLDCTNRTTGLVTTRLAVLPTRCDTAYPTGHGYRLQLQVGNPTAGRIDGLKATLYAGAGAARGRSDKRMYLEVPVSIPPGAWAAIDVDFDGLQQDDLDQLAVRAQVRGISLAAQ